MNKKLHKQLKRKIERQLNSKGCKGWWGWGYQGSFYNWGYDIDENLEILLHGVDWSLD